jgi:nicotinamide mononucleotide adenylyltransferase
MNAPVTRVAMAKYKWLEPNYALVQAIMDFPTFEELKQIRKTALDKVPATGEGPESDKNKCDKYPMFVGCKGQQPATTLAILLRGTKFGKAQFVKNKEQLTKLYNDKIYTPELKDFIQKAIASIDDAEMKIMNDTLQSMGVQKDPVKDTPQKIASDFANNDGKITDKNQLDFLLGKIALANDIKVNEQRKKMNRLRSIISEIIKEEYNLVTEELLLEGGAGGHMRHPFDLDDVKTGEQLIEKFKQIGDEIKAGNRPDTKIDGVNTSIKIVDTPKGKQFAMDRGTSIPIDVEGITTDRLPERFSAGHGMIPAGKNVLGIFNDALKEATPELEALGVLDDPTKFFNMEYVKGTTNVLAYDHDFLKIHGVNQFYEKKNRKGEPVRPGLERPIDSETKKPIKDPSVPVAYDQEVMDRLVEKLNKVAGKYGFKVYSAIPSKSTGDFDFSPVMNVPVPVTYSKGEIEEKTLGDRLKVAENRIKETVETIDGREPPAQGKEIYKAVLGASAADTNADLKRQIPLDQLLLNKEDYQKAIDGAVFWHATRLLGNVIMDNMEVDHPAVSGPATEHEGLVIRLSGDDFDTKITGEFILGGEATTFRSAEDGVDKKEKPEEREGGKNIAIFPGSFKPPHKGHLSIVSSIARAPEVDEIKVIISAPSKKVRSPKITPEKAKAIFEKYIKSAGISNATVEISDQASPVRAAYDYVAKKAGPNENILLLTSAADPNRYPQKVIDQVVASNKNADTITATERELTVCRDEGCDTAGKISATTIRNIVDAYPEITLQDLTKAVDHMPDSMSTADKLATFEMLVDDSLSNKFEDEELNTLNEFVRFIMETIDKALDVVLLTEKVRKTRGKKEYCVVSKKKKTKKGKLRKYGCYKSRKAANKRLGQVEGFKARAMAEGEELEEYEIVEVSSNAGGDASYGSGPLGMTRRSITRRSIIREED